MLPNKQMWKMDCRHSLLCVSELLISFVVQPELHLFALNNEVFFWHRHFMWSTDCNSKCIYEHFRVFQNWIIAAFSLLFNLFNYYPNTQSGGNSIDLNVESRCAPQPTDILFIFIDLLAFIVLSFLNTRAYMY